jgi:tagatose-6-phosphate ketose/aldose isomerase
MKEPMAALGLTEAQIDAGGASFTAREIAQQPSLWPEVARLVENDAKLTAFLASLLGDEAPRVVLTGAGTSAYIGECLAPALIRRGAGRIDPIATTDIVASPESWLSRRTPTLLVSFARSGNSPESVAAVELAEQIVTRCAHLIVTCNEQGELYRRAASMRDTHALLLPEALNDQSFAMTSSFTGMLLAAGTALGAVPAGEERVVRLGALAAHVIEDWMPRIDDLVGARFERVVYLGSNELKALAREAALKMLELTDGQVVSMADSPLGFRHGPKTILNGKTLVVLFLSNDAHTRRYELDLLHELRRDAVAGRVIALSNLEDLPAHRDTLVLADAADAADAGVERFTDLELCLPYVVFAQLLAMLRSLSLKLSPDKPNAAGTVSRVVQGVSIYPYSK